jgi:guanylate kinase
MRVGDNEIARKGCLFIVSGPSGAGKTSICTPALAKLENLTLSVSTTTRAPRAGETPGVDYRFVSDDDFDVMVARAEFAEWAEVHGFRYGTPKALVDQAREGGRDLLLDVDVQGAAQLKRAYPDAVSVFLLPPSKERLAERLRARKTDSEEVVLRRLRNACGEIAELAHYDYVIVNDVLDRAIESFFAIVHAERAKVARIRPTDVAAILRAFD